MKTLGRILVILAVFVLAMGVVYVAVNAGTSATSTNAPQFDRGLSPDGDRPAFAEGQRPEFPNGERHEFRGERGGRWMFGTIKNVGIVAIIVTLIVLPKGWFARRRKAAQIAS